MVAARCVALADGISLSYGILVLAAGATHAYSVMTNGPEFAPSLKSILRRTQTFGPVLLLSFEQAEMSDDPASASV